LSDLTDQKNAYIHVGTHKTGTSSLQMCFHSNPRFLAENGILYPQQCRVAGAQHQAAWEFMGDERFGMTEGNSASLIQEIVQSNYTRSVFSSEDFECCLVDNSGFQDFIGSLKRAGITPHIVIYFRSQVQYAESLYLEMLKHGYDQTFRAYTDEILSCGSVRFKKWIFWFDYSRVLASLQRLEVKISVRRYRAGFNTITDFCTLLGLPNRPERRDSINERDDVSFSYKQFSNNAGLPVETIATDRRLHMARSTRALFISRFSEHAPIVPVDEGEIASACSFEEVFKARISPPA
jgi:hypothetical protein